MHRHRKQTVVQEGWLYPVKALTYKVLLIITPSPSLLLSLSTPIQHPTHTLLLSQANTLFFFFLLLLLLLSLGFLFGEIKIGGKILWWRRVCRKHGCRWYDEVHHRRLWRFLFSIFRCLSQKVIIIPSRSPSLSKPTFLFSHGFHAFHSVLSPWFSSYLE